MVELGGARHFAAHQPDASTVFQVDGREEDQDPASTLIHPRQRRRGRRCNAGAGRSPPPLAGEGWGGGFNPPILEFLIDEALVVVMAGYDLTVDTGVVGVGPPAPIVEALVEADRRALGRTQIEVEHDKAKLVAR